jgi:uncharacterized protein (DUF2141 family)
MFQPSFLGNPMPTLTHPKLRTAFAACSRVSLSVSALFGGLLFAASAQAADLTVQVHNIEESNGTVMVALFSREADFMKNNSYTQQRVAASRSPEGSLQLRFVDLPPGTYALSVFHDRNSNGKLDTNMLGMPSEPFGFSNAAKASFGPPKFGDAAITLGTDNSTAAIQLQ